jgi:tRNA (guanine-N7-)-methyltransferase
VLNAEGRLRNRSPAGSFVQRNPSRLRTRFEARGEQLGHAVHDLCYERISACDREPASRR